MYKKCYATRLGKINIKFIYGMKQVMMKLNGIILHIKNVLNDKAKSIKELDGEN